MGHIMLCPSVSVCPFIPANIQGFGDIMLCPLASAGLSVHLSKPTFKFGGYFGHDYEVFWGLFHLKIH